ncbi:vesicle-associated membrane protein-associated protein B [Cephus cinctus]|uniref:Vesicle-associated membrane protein-associated protein B n=1 Tax=Cephus cinctus TaxID=211228 RepID=A0AAJ7FD55_CEPCN|nr:vesicle-associated membrane protein-associated protein B [Cephus cinctus]
MSKPQQVLQIEPKSELKFTGPFIGIPVTAYMKLTNPTDNKVYFKIKTTAPKRYCVRPNSGSLKPKQTINVAVTLQSHDFDPAEKKKHKFMVQTLLAPEDDTDQYFLNDNVWKGVNPEQLMDSKLKCVFETPTSSEPADKQAASTTGAKLGTSATNGKDDKCVGDWAGASTKLVKVEDELARAAQEVTLLRADESCLRQENLQLREELLKLRNTVMGTASVTSGNMAAIPGTTSHTDSLLNVTTTSVLIAIAMVVVGYLLGKLI